MNRRGFLAALGLGAIVAPALPRRVYSFLWAPPVEPVFWAPPVGLFGNILHEPYPDGLADMLYQPASTLVLRSRLEREPQLRDSHLKAARLPIPPAEHIEEVVQNLPDTIHSSYRIH